MDEIVDWEAMARYLSGESPPEERHRMDIWIEGDPLRKEYVDSLRLVWNSAGRQPSDWDIEAAWERVTTRAGIPRHPARPPSPSRSRMSRETFHRRSLAEFFRFAAAAVALIAIPYAFFHFFAGTETGPLMREVATGRAERARVRLTDGTTVVLNAESLIRFPESFSNGRRELILQGEAFFDVATIDQLPFIVHVGNGLVEVLGTEFAVRAWPEEQNIQVVVAEGSVAFRSAGPRTNPGVILHPGQISHLSTDGSLSSPQPVNLSTHLDWLEGRLVFENALFSEVIKRMHRVYGVDVSVDDSSILRRRLTATFSGETIDEIGRILALTLDLKYARNGNLISFRSLPRLRNRTSP